MPVSETLALNKTVKEDLNVVLTLRIDSFSLHRGKQTCFSALCAKQMMLSSGDWLGI